MSHKATSWAVDVKGLPWPTKGILMLLADCHNGSTGQCNPQIAWLMEKSELKERAIQGHLKLLEKAKLIERQYENHGRGKGRTLVQYTLNLKIKTAVSAPENDDLQTQELAGANTCSRKNTSMQPQELAPSYSKEEPEENRNTKYEIGFEEAWSAYQRSPLKAQQKKKPAKAQWARSIKLCNPEQILKAINLEVQARVNADGFVANLPDMHRWLRDECWQDALRDLSPKSTTSSDLEPDEWASAFRHYVDTGNWLFSAISPAPHETGCTAPAKMLRHAATLVQPERAELIQQNLKLGEAA